MATLRCTDDELQVVLTRSEKLAGLHGDLRLPIAAVRDVRVEPDALAAVKGLRAPGLSIPGRTRIGTWRRRGARGFVVARRGVPAVRVTLSGVKPDEVLVSTAEAQAVAERLRARCDLPGRGAEPAAPRAAGG